VRQAAIFLPEAPRAAFYDPNSGFRPRNPRPAGNDQFLVIIRHLTITKTNRSRPKAISRKAASLEFRENFVVNNRFSSGNPSPNYQFVSFVVLHLQCEIADAPNSRMKNINWARRQPLLLQRSVFVIVSEKALRVWP